MQCRSTNKYPLQNKCLTQEIGSHADLENDLNNDSNSTLRHRKYQEAFWEKQKRNFAITNTCIGQNSCFSLKKKIGCNEMNM